MQKLLMFLLTCSLSVSPLAQFGQGRQGTPGPNLLFENVVVPAAGMEGDSLPISFAIANRGREAAGEFTYSIAWSLAALEEGELPPIEALVDSGRIQGLGVGERIMLGGTPFIIPRAIVRDPDQEGEPSGEPEVFLHFILDNALGNGPMGPGQIEEEDESDNLHTERILVLEDTTALPDYVVVPHGISPSSVQAGNSVQVQFTLKNLGGLDAPHALSIVLSLDNNWNPSTDLELLAANLAPLKANRERYMDLDLEIPLGVQEGGAYKVLIIADATGVIEEQQEDNNIGSLDLEVIVPGNPPQARLSKGDSFNANNPEVFSLNVFPNPVYGSTHITYSLAQSKVAQLRLRDLLGRTVQVYPLFQRHGEFPLSMGDLTPGIYFLSLDTEQGQQVSRRIIKR